MLLEERDDRPEQIRATSHDVAVQVLPVIVVPVVDDHLTNSKELTKVMETRKTSLSLCYRELVSHLVSGSVASSAWPARLADKAD